ncbi:MAG: tRNA (adenosine(37)-N6)-threonylcarbamoyltransferase complex ATPase subunit type 1 TsaE [Opitutaceae bacterium]
MNKLVQKLIRGVTTESAKETEKIAGAFASAVPFDSVIAFHGDLGAGKTTFIRGLARGWGIQEPVTSPTFNLYTLYEGDRQLIHLDAYRLESGADLDALMIDDFLQSPWCLAVEWSERVADSLPDDAWHLHLGIDAQQNHTIRLEIP